MASILIVDDAPDAAYALEQVLEAAGHAVALAADARSALHYVAEIGCDVALISLQLPGGSAHTLVDQIRLVDRDVGLIATVTDGLTLSSAHARRARGQHITAVLRKPFDAVTLLDAIDGITDGAAKRQTVTAPDRHA